MGYPEPSQYAKRQVVDGMETKAVPAWRQYQEKKERDDLITKLVASMQFNASFGRQVIQPGQRPPGGGPPGGPGGGPPGGPGGGPPGGGSDTPPDLLNPTTSSYNTASEQASFHSASNQSSTTPTNPDWPTESSSVNSRDLQELQDMLDRTQEEANRLLQTLDPVVPFDWESQLDDEVDMTRVYLPEIDREEIRDVYGDYYSTVSEGTRSDTTRRELEDLRNFFNGFSNRSTSSSAPTLFEQASASSIGDGMNPHIQPVSDPSMSNSTMSDNVRHRRRVVALQTIIRRAAAARNWDLRDRLQQQLMLEIEAYQTARRDAREFLIRPVNAENPTTQNYYQNYVNYVGDRWVRRRPRSGSDRSMDTSPPRNLRRRTRVNYAGQQGSQDTSGSSYSS